MCKCLNLCSKPIDKHVWMDFAEWIQCSIHLHVDNVQIMYQQFVKSVFTRFQHCFQHHRMLPKSVMTGYPNSPSAILMSACMPRFILLYFSIDRVTSLLFPSGVSATIW